MNVAVFIGDSRMYEIVMAKFDRVGVYEHFGGRVNDLKAAVEGERTGPMLKPSQPGYDHNVVCWVCCGSLQGNQRGQRVWHQC